MLGQNFTIGVPITLTFNVLSAGVGRGTLSAGLLPLGSFVGVELLLLALF